LSYLCIKQNKEIMTKTITIEQKKLITESAQLIGKDINYVSHHDAFPSNYVSGIIVGVRLLDYNEKQIVLIVIDRDGEERKISICQVIVNGLLESGNYESNHAWSKSTTYIKVK